MTMRKENRDILMFMIGTMKLQGKKFLYRGKKTCYCRFGLIITIRYRITYF